MLQPVYPGQMVTVRKNLFNAVLVADLGTAEGLELVAAAHGVYRQQWPVRFGLLSVSSGGAGAVKHCVGFSYAKR